MIFASRNEKYQKRNFDREWNLAISASLERFATATTEHFSAHARLEEIATWKSAEKNLPQQAGYSAETKSVARTNADAIIKGASRRVVRTDDLGMVNHTVYDQVDVDAKGNPILGPDGSIAYGAQQKVHAKISTYREHWGENFDKYRTAKLIVPSDQLASIKADWNEQLRNLEEQRAKVEKLNKPDVSKDLDRKIERLRDAESRLEDSGVSTADSMEARRNPILSTTKDVLRVSHRAGLEGAKSGAAIGGVFSSVRNLMAVGKGRKKASTALVDAATDTGRAALTSYATSATASAMGGALKATSSQVCQNLAKGGGPAAVLQAGIIISTHVFHLVDGRITPEQFVAGVSRDGAVLASSLAGSSVGAIVGTVVLPGVGTLVGGVVGGMVASLMCGIVHTELQKSIALTTLSEERREAIQHVCRGLVNQERLYRHQIVEVFEEFYGEKEADIDEGFQSVAFAMQHGESIQSGLMRISAALGFELRFVSDDALLQHMNSGETLVL